MSIPPDHAETGNPSLYAIGHIDPVFSAQRISYGDQGLDVVDLPPTPLEMFRRWYDQARAAQVIEPNAMTLATVDAAGIPTARTVLLKHADADGFVFFTNRRSRKGMELAVRPVAAIVLAWLPLHRQVCARGPVEQISDTATAEYFGTRPWGSRIGAWASHQSRPIESRAELERRWAELSARWPDHGRPDDVPVPPHWGGYVVRPFEVEFWQGRPSRMHDRLVFLPTPDRSVPELTTDVLARHLPPGLPALDDATAWRVERREP
jgi:pyridoxamine 5'-phosphate oxidase